MAIPITRSRPSGPLQPRGPRWVRRLRDLGGVVGAAITVPVPVRRVAEIPLTTLGLAAIDGAAFVGNLIAGLAVTGVSLVLLEYLIADA